MKKAFFTFLVLQTVCSFVQAQHYQKLVNDVTACGTYACIEGVIKKNKSLEKYKPVKKGFGMEAQRILLDFEYPYKFKDQNLVKNFRLSLFISGDSLYYGMLEQYEGMQLEASYQFINQISELENHVTTYNQQHKTKHSYKDLINSITSREPEFWIWSK